jgi:hypothetical protein
LDEQARAHGYSDYLDALEKLDKSGGLNDDLRFNQQVAEALASAAGTAAELTEAYTSGPTPEVKSASAGVGAIAVASEAARKAGLWDKLKKCFVKGKNWGPQHGGDKHWERIRQIADAMERNGWTDIRINRQQVDAAGNVVGKNRPDISGINPRTGQRHNIEIDTSPRSSATHQSKVDANDPSAANTYIVLPE